MTRHAIYHASPGHIVEQPTMEKPPIELKKFTEGTTEYYATKIRWDEYNKAVAECRTIPVHESARSLWKDGQKAEEGKEYRIQLSCSGNFEVCERQFRCSDCTPIAFPLPVKSEDPDDIWFELLKHVGMDEEFILNWITELKQKYIITKR